jgi:hypothetical protein
MTELGNLSRADTEFRRTRRWILILMALFFRTGMALILSCSPLLPHKTSDSALPG